MKPINNTKWGLMLPPQLKDNGDFASNTYIDTAGYNHLRVIIATGATDADVGSTAETAAPFLEECDTTGGSYTAITGAALASVIADDEDSKIFAFDVDLTKTRKRYIQVNAPHSADGTNGATLCIIGVLSEPNIAPSTAAEAGLTELISV